VLRLGSDRTSHTVTREYLASSPASIAAHMLPAGGSNERARVDRRFNCESTSCRSIEDRPRCFAVHVPSMSTLGGPIIWPLGQIANGGESPLTRPELIGEKSLKLAPLANPAP
jgi:hypothetical protein